MQISQVLPNLTKRWSSTWKARQLSRRLGGLAYQFLSYILITLLILGVAASMIHQLVSIYLQYAGTQFIALIYLCSLGIATAHSFDTDETRFLLKQISIDLDHIATTSGTADLDSIREAINELTIRMGQS